MTDEEAYELLVKWAGELGISLIQEMIHIAGVDTALKNMERAYKNHGKIIDDEFKSWMRQAFNHLVNKTENQN